MYYWFVLIVELVNGRRLIWPVRSVYDILEFRLIDRIGEALCLQAETASPVVRCPPFPVSGLMQLPA